MERKKIARIRQLQFHQQSNNTTRKNNLYQSKDILKNPIVKGAIIIGGIYGVLFLSKYIINEYAEVVIATKKLRDACQR